MSAPYAALRPGRAGYSGGRLSALATLLSAAGNVILYGGSPDETISGRSYREGDRLGNARWARRRVLIDRVFGEGHCRASHEEDVFFARAILNTPEAP